MKLLWLPFFIISFSVQANFKGEFKVSFEHTGAHVDSAKTNAELSMARDTRYCRGAMMPRRSGPWQCQPQGGGQRCEARYSCSRIHPEFNRQTETMRLVQAARQSPQVGQVRLSFSAPPPSAPTQSGVVSESLGDQPVRTAMEGENTQATAAPAPSSPAPAPTPSSETVSASTTSLNRGQGRERPVPSQTRPPTDRSNLVRGDLELNRRAFDEEEADLLAMMDDPLPVRKVTMSEETLSRLSFANFALGMNRVTNSNEGELTTFNFAWTPHYYFEESRYALRAQLGGHLFESRFQDEEERFLVIESLGFFQARFGELVVFEAGAGQQYWNVDGGQSFFTLSFGGYLSSRQGWLGIIDRIGLNYQRVSTEDNGQELRATIGIRF
jgi:hypothetical protein